MRSAAAVVERVIGTRRNSRYAWFPAILALLSSLPLAQAGSNTVVGRGQAVVTQFSGTVAPAKAPKDVHPLDVTLIDVEKPSLRVIDLDKLGGPPTASLANAPSKFEVKAGDIGQVFAVTLDSTTAAVAPDIYAGATSLYGLHIVERDGKDNIVRLVKGSPRAEWMPGQFGTDKGGGPGTIWRIDGKTGEALPFANIMSGSAENAGPGIGGLAYDPVSQQIFGSSLETGVIHRLDIAGRELSTFDHGTQGRTKAGLEAVADDPGRRMDIKSPDFSVEDPATWGFAAPERRVVALSVENGRLYYTVAEGPSVWSVGLNADGSFADDARRELDVTGTDRGDMVTALAFDGPDKLYLAQRGETTGSYDYSAFARQETASVLRYTFDATSKSWRESAEEYAVGLTTRHRATNGGLAFNYGYDAQGSIDFGRCRETLWITGEHLGGDGDKAQTIHGLQGGGKDQAQSAVEAAPRSGSLALQRSRDGSSERELSAPSDVWFTDNDGELAEDEDHGRLGAIAIYMPCDKTAAAEPPRPVVPFGPDVPHRPVPGIFVSKTCLPGLLGAQITCRISVTNTGIAASDPVLVSDVATSLLGPGAGGNVNVIAVTPDAPDWACSPVPTPALQCVLPAGTVLPGTTRFIDVVVDTGPLALAGNLGFRNCATLGAPFASSSCVNWGLPGGSGLTIAKTGPAVCNPGTNCAFTVTIANTTAFPFSGNVQISDAMFVGGASQPAPIVASTLTCTGGNPAALPFTCVEPVTLAPGATLTQTLTVTMPAAPPNYWAQNCFAAFDPTFAPPGGPLPVPGGPGGAAFGSPANPSCAWVKAGNPPPQSNLRIAKQAVGPACDSSLGSGQASCHYQITISNDGPSPFTGPITLNEVTPVGSNLLLNPNWPCVAAAPGFACTSPAPVTLAPGASTVVNATIVIPALLTEPTCLVTNNAAIGAPVGPASNVVAADDTATATTSTALLAIVNPDGTVTVACDPTNLKTVKALKGPCTASGGGFQCKFLITVSNTGPDPYQGPIHVTDSFAGAPTSVSFSSGWTCSGAGATRQCVKPNVKLSPPGKPGPNSVELEVTATFPGGKTCVAENTATMTFPLAGTRFNGRGDDDTSQVSAPLPSPECEERPRCEKPEEGEFVTRSGACACKEGYERDRSGHCVGEETRSEPTPEPEPVVTPEANLCPDGNPIPRNGVCPCPSGLTWSKDTLTCEGACTPGENEYRSSSGRCLCRTGYTRRSGICVAISEPEGCEPGPNEYQTARGYCICREGYDRDEQGRCVREPEICIPGPNEYVNFRGECACKPGFVPLGGRCVRPQARCVPGPYEYVDRDGYCVCRDGFDRDHYGRCVRIIVLCVPGPHEYRTWHGECICQEGYEHDRSGRCVREDAYCKPGPNEYRTPDNRCVCLRGYDRDRNGRCMPKQEKCEPGPNEYRTPDNRCICLKGYDRDEQGRCRREDVHDCPGSMVYDKRLEKCVPRDQHCPGGQHYDDGKCVPDGTSRPEEECRAKGGKWKSDRCIVEEGPTPEDQCKKQGGKWVGNKCITGEDTRPEEQCRAKGGMWKNGQCIIDQGPSPEDQCKKQGGKWVGNKCVTDQDTKPEEQCRAKGGKWKNGQCVVEQGPSPQDQCKQKGGTWKNGTCVTASEPPPKPEKSCKNGKILDAATGKCIWPPKNEHAKPNKPSQDQGKKPETTTKPDQGKKPDKSGPCKNPNKVRGPDGKCVTPS